MEQSNTLLAVDSASKTDGQRASRADAWTFIVDKDALNRQDEQWQWRVEDELIY